MPDPESTPQDSHRLVNLELDLSKFVSTSCTDEDGHVLVEQPKDPRDFTNTNLEKLQSHDPIQHSHATNGNLLQKVVELNLCK